jgi:myo-inositol-1(or 4)-monophosphatase
MSDNRALHHLIDALSHTARETGMLLKAIQAMPRQIEEKSPHNLVTDADQAAEALIIERLSAHFPGARLLLEESGEQQASGHGFEHLRFIVDPLDGTTNYASRIPHFAVSIAAEQEGELVGAAIYDPWRDELFWAALGLGAWVVDALAPTGRRLQVSATEKLRDIVVATGFPYSRYDDPSEDNQPEFCALNLSTRGCRRNGAATLDLAWVAAGRFEAYWERGLAPWDVAAGALLVREAGGATSNYLGGGCDPMAGEVVASNGHVHARLLGLLQRARSARQAHQH